MAGAAEPAAQRQRLGARWALLYFEIVDCVDDSRYSEQSLRLRLPVLGVCDDADDDSVDLTGWLQLLAYIREELRLGPSPAIELRLVGTPAIAHNQASLAGIHRMLDRTSVNLEEPIVLEAHSRLLPAAGTAGAMHMGVTVPELHMGITGPELTPVFGLRPLSQKELAAQLRPLCYPANLEEGQWTTACNELMMQSPSLLLSFDELRAEGFARAIGDGRFLINPLRMACPACATVLWMQAANHVGNLDIHLRTCRATCAAAIRRRLEGWRNNNQITAAGLDRIAELPPGRPAPPVDRPDFFPRPAEWLLPWLRVLVMGLTTQHVFVQMLIAVLYMVCGCHQLYWGTHFPALLSFAHEAYYTVRPKGYRLLRGPVFTGQGRRSDTRIAVAHSEVGPGDTLVCRIDRPKAWQLQLAKGSMFWCSEDRSYRFQLVELLVAPGGAAHAVLVLCAVEGNITLLCGRPFELVRQRQLLSSLFNFLLPSESTLKYLELSPTYETATHFHKVFALQLALATSPTAPALRSDACVALLGVLHFDERPINKSALARLLVRGGVKSAHLLGIYERQPDGVLKPFSAARCRQLVQAGPAHVRAALTRACFTSSVKEFNVQALDASVSLNVRTEYVVGEEDHVRVRRSAQTKPVHVHVHACVCACACHMHVHVHVHHCMFTHTHTRAWQAAAALRLASRELRACDGCIRAGCPLACCIQEIGKPCNQCAEVGRKCTYLFAPMSCCDQGSGQRKACEQLTAAFDSDHAQWEEETGCDVQLARPLYLRPLHGFLHGLKGLVGFLRNYRIVGEEGEGEFGVVFLTAIATSNGPAAKALLECTEADVFNYLDRHADTTCFLTVHEPVQAVLRSVGHVKVTLAPEPFCIWAARVANHENLLRPASVAVNSSGELIFSDAEGHLIAGLTRNYPSKMIVLAGRHLEPGVGGEDVRGTAAQLRHPLQVALLEVARRKEHLLICDTGNRRLRLLSNVQQLDATKPVIHTITIRGLLQGERIVPRAVAVVRSHHGGTLAPLLAIGDGSKSRVLLVALDANLRAGCVLTGQQYNFPSPYGLASLDNRLYVASKQTVGLILLGGGGTAEAQVSRLSKTFIHAADVAVAPSAAAGTHRVAVADSTAHTIVLMVVTRDGSCQVLAKWGSGVSRNVDGPIASAAFQEPCGIIFFNGSLYVASFGGESGGLLCVVTPTTFGERFCRLMQEAYEAIGFVNPRLNREAAALVRAARSASDVRVQLPRLRAIVEAALAICKVRSAAIGGLVADGGSGAFHRHSVLGLQFTLANVQAFLNDLEAAGGSIRHVALYALLNETIIEGQFGLQVIMTQADNPTQFQHAAAKPKADRHAINLMAMPPFAMGGIHRRATYQQVDVGEWDASVILREVELAHKVLHPPVQLTQAQHANEEAILMDMKVLAVNALSQRCSTARSKYKRPTAVNPTILVHMNALDAPDNVTRLTSFEVELQRVLSRGPQATARVTTAFVDLGHSRDEYLYLEGDISFCVAGDVVRADKSGADAAEELWWAFQLASRFAHSRLTGPRPH